MAKFIEGDKQKGLPAILLFIVDPSRRVKGFLSSKWKLRARDFRAKISLVLLAFAI